MMNRVAEMRMITWNENHQAFSLDDNDTIISAERINGVGTWKITVVRTWAHSRGSRSINDR